MSSKERKGMWTRHVSVMLLIGYCIGALETSHAADPPGAQAAIGEFVLMERELLEQRHRADVTAADWNTKYSRFIESEARRLQGLMPGILPALAERLGYRSNNDKQLEELLKVKHPTDQQLLNIKSLLEASTGQRGASRCGLAFLTGYLGRSAPKEAIDTFLTEAPTTERS